MKRKRMIGWLVGIPLTVIVLVVVILLGEIPKDGVTRAAAYKAAALCGGTVEECRLLSEKESAFPASSQRQWYVKYLDALYQKGWITKELAPPDEKEAESLLTYGEADYLAAQVSENLKGRVAVTEKNRSKPYPTADWWKLYEDMCREAGVWEEEKGVREETFQVYGTFEDMTDGVSWRGYTSEGVRGFEGLGLGNYRDREIRALVSGSEIIRIIEKVSDSVIYKNVWVMEAKEKELTAFVGSLTRHLPVKSKVKEPQEMVCQIADVYLTDGAVKKIVIKKERVSGKVLEVRDDMIEIEGYGQVPLDEDFRVYRLYGELRRQGLSDVLVGYDAQEFVVADGYLCAALTLRPVNAETIRVLIMNTGFGTIFHDSITLEFLGAGVMITGDKEERFEAGTIMTFRTGDPKLARERVILRMDDENGGIRIPTISRGDSTPCYPGHLEIKQESEGLVMVNEVYLEEYLKRVVPSEMPASYEPEALKTQAVCARTYAWRQIMANSYKNYGAHVDDSTRYQVYNNTETYESTDAAVNDTYGKMVMYHGQVAEIYYFSTSCGHTTDGTIWGADPSSYPYLKGVAVKEGGGTLDLTDDKAFSEYIKSSPSGFESQFAMYRWNTKLTSSQLEAKVPGIGNITGLTMKERSVGGIGKVLVVEGSSGSKEIRGEGQIRGTLGCRELVIERQDKTTVTGWDALPSAFVAIEAGQPDSNGVITFTIYGGGYGHGVGMSQNGAQGMAKAGKTYRQILEFFYPGAEAAEIDEIS